MLREVKFISLLSFYLIGRDDKSFATDVHPATIKTELSIFINHKVSATWILVIFSSNLFGSAF